MTVTFGSPPRRGGPSGWSPYPLDEWADALRARPGEWAQIDHPLLDNDTKRRSLAGNIRTGRAFAFRPAGSFEAIGRKADGVVQVFARFVGEQP